MVTLGLNLIGNDTSAAIVDDDGTVVAVAEEERYSRVKGGRRWAPPRWILEVLAEFDVPREEVGTVATSRIQALHALRPVASADGPGVAYWGEAKRASLDWLARRLPRCESVVEVRHHLCHAASAFYASPFETAAVVTVDGMGEVETATVWAAGGDGLRQVWSRSLPHSLGLAYEAVAQWVGLTGVEKEGKLMGLAPLGTPRYRAEIEESFLRPDEQDVFTVGPAVAALPHTTGAWASYLERLFGPPGPGGNDVRELDADVAASIQAVVEECLAGLLRKARALTGADRCAAAGGVFLNAVANGMLERAGLFEDLWFQPLAGDTGTSLGAALAARGGRASRKRMRHLFLGSGLGDPDAAARERGLEPAAGEDAIEQAASLVLGGGIVAWASGRAEAGPRALGHRSIFADPRHPEVRDAINARVKDRELWRPFAPILLEEDAPALFGSAQSAPYMNTVAQATQVEPMRAAVHLDGSARLQTVPQDEPELAEVRALLLAVKARTGFGVLLNTSLNGRGEPIARTAADVIDVYRSCSLDGLVLDGRLFVPSPQRGFDRDGQTETLGDGDWWLLAPWWEPRTDLVLRSLRRAGYEAGTIRLVDADELGDAAAAGTATGLVVAVPVWSEIAVDALGGLLSGWSPEDWAGASLPVLCLDEDGRVAAWEGRQAEDMAAIARWWSTRTRSRAVAAR